MSQRRLILDELWHCLCPSFRLSTLRRHSVILSAKRRPRPSSSAFTRALSAYPQGCYSSNSAERGDGPSVQNEESDRDGNMEASGGSEEDLSKENKKNVEKLLHFRKTWRTPDVPMQLRPQTTPQLEAKLRGLADRNPNVHNALQILRLLIRDRCIRPEARHYKWLIQCHSDPHRGSPILVRRLLLEMEENGIPADSGTLHAALQALAVHPDYMLRQDVLRALRDRWLPLSPDGWHFVVAGLIREHQFELALDHIAHMERKEIPVKDWLHSLLIYYLCEFKEFDQIHQLMRSRLRQGHDMTPELWMHVLDEATTAFHYDTTSFIWDRMVELGYLHPEHRLCSQVLNVAAREGDAELASSVVHFLTHNDIPLEVGDYEKLSETHLKSGNLYAAFEAFCATQPVGVVLPPDSTQNILAHCLQSKLHPRKVWAMLKKIKATGHEIPVACARVVIAMCEDRALNDPFEVDDGIAFYKELYALCREQPDTATFNTLIGMCRRAKNTESAMFVVKEMAAFGVLPDAKTFEHLIVMCLESGNFESAYLYFQDLRERGLHLTTETRIKVRELCADSKDEYALKLWSHPEVGQESIRSVDDKECAAQKLQMSQKVENTSTGEITSLPEHTKVEDIRQEKAHHGYRRMSKDARRQYNKERRKRKRRLAAIAKTQEDDDWMDYEPSLTIDDPLLNKYKPTG